MLLGHRGASRYAPENTIAAFDLALQQGCDGFEFDVRYTQDARCVICHNPRYRRRRIDKSIFSDLSLPCAEDVIRKYAGRAYLDVELKVLGNVRPVLEALQNAGDRYVISSFLPEVLREVHKLNPGIPTGLICENALQLKPWSELPICAVMLHQRLAKPALIDRVHHANKRVFVWTVNRERNMRRLASLGVDGLISDDTQLLARTLSQK